MFRARKLSPLFVLVILSLLASACSALNASPTPSLQELQLTAQAAAAATLTAQAPTATPVTPSPSPTPIPTLVSVAPLAEIVPTQPVVVVQPQPALVAQSAATEEKQEQDCGKSYISAGTEGPRAPVHIINKKGASITLSYYLELNAHGQCGSGSLNLVEEDKLLNLPAGCYWLYAWVTYDGRDESFQGYSCLSQKEDTAWLVFPDRFEEVKN